MKVNLGNYESADFFASQRAECPADMAAETSRDLDQFCMDEVAESIRAFRERRRRNHWRMRSARTELESARASFKAAAAKRRGMEVLHVGGVTGSETEALGVGGSRE